MKTFNNELKVGDLAMIINTHCPENRHLIGSVVKVEMFMQVGDIMTDYYLGAASAGVMVVVKPSCTARVLVSGCRVTGKSSGEGFSMRDGYCNINEKYLMPIPPLGDDVLDTSFVEVLDNLKVTG